MNRKAAWTAAVLAVVLLYVHAAALPVQAAGEQLRLQSPKKIISVVYDDSGSMFWTGGNTKDNTSWAAANYAIQAMTALMSSKDELYITYMSSPETAAAIDLSHIDRSVRSLREDLTDPGNTPGEAVDTAIEKLFSIEEDDPSTQFWLVVMTDGALESGGNMQDKLDAAKGSIMSNGSLLHIDYMGIGGSVNIQDDPGQDLQAFYAPSSGDITSVMSEIANQTGGRLPFREDKITVVSGTQIRVHSDIPLFTLAILSQNSDASVTNVESTEKLRIEQNVHLEYPTYQDYKTDDSLRGNAAVITNGSNLIAEGDYTITFSESVDPAHLDVFYEPAIALDIRLLMDGTVVEDPNTLRPGHVVTAEIRPLIPGTDREIDPAYLPEGVTFELTYTRDGNELGRSDTQTLSDIRIDSGDNIIRGSMTIPGYAPIVCEIPSFQAIEYGIETVQPDDVSYARAHLNKTPANGNVSFYILGNGTRFTKEELGNAALEITNIEIDRSALSSWPDLFGSRELPLVLSVRDDGAFELHPKGLSFSILLAPFNVIAGEYKVTVALNVDGQEATGTLTVVPGFGEWLYVIILLCILLLILYLLYVFLVKYKFHGQKVHVDYYQLKADGGGIRKKGMGGTYTLSFLSKDLLLPRRACHKKILGLDFEADGPAVKITGKSLKSACVKFGKGAKSVKEMEKSLGKYVSKMKTTKAVKGKAAPQIADQYPGSTPIIIMTGEGSKEVIAITLE